MGHFLLSSDKPDPYLGEPPSKSLYPSIRVIGMPWGEHLEESNIIYNTLSTGSYKMLNENIDSPFFTEKETKKRK